MDIRLPAYGLHKATGQAVVRFSIDGKQKCFYLGKYNSPESRRKYKDACAAWLREEHPKREERDGPEIFTVRDLAQQYAARIAARDRKPHHTAAAIRILVEIFGDHPVSEYDVDSHDWFKDELIRRRYARDYGNELLRVVVRVLRYGMQRKRVTDGSDHPPAWRRSGCGSVVL